MLLLNAQKVANAKGIPLGKAPGKDFLDMTLTVLGEVKTMIHEERVPLPAISSVCFYTHSPSPHQCTHMSHNSKAGVLVSYLKSVVN